MSKDAALKTALEVLEWINRVNAMDYEYQQKAREALNAIYEALAPTSTQCEVQDELCSSQEPVGFMNAGHVHEMQQGRLPYGYVYPKGGVGADIAVYTTPPKEQQSCDKRPWVGLTATAKLDLLSTAKGVGGRINGDAQLLELLTDHETQLKRKNT